jgi:hypothetical protein
MQLLEGLPKQAPDTLRIALPTRAQGSRLGAVQHECRRLGDEHRGRITDVTCAQNLQHNGVDTSLTGAQAQKLGQAGWKTHTRRTSLHARVHYTRGATNGTFENSVSFVWLKMK